MENDQTSFANGVLKALKTIKLYSLNGNDVAIDLAGEIVEDVGGIEFLQDFSEFNNEDHQEIIDWYKFVFEHG